MKWGSDAMWNICFEKQNKIKIHSFSCFYYGQKRRTKYHIKMSTQILLVFGNGINDMGQLLGGQTIEWRLFGKTVEIKVREQPTTKPNQTKPDKQTCFLIFHSILFE